MVDKNQELQQKMFQFQMLQSGVHALQEREEMVLRDIEELKRTKSAIDELDGIKTANAYIPLGSGNFVEGTVSSVKNILIGVGSGVAVKKSKEDALKHLDERIKESEKAIIEIGERGEMLLRQLSKLQAELESQQ